MSLQESKESTTTTMHSNTTSGCYMDLRQTSVPHLKQLLLTLNTELSYKTIIIIKAANKKDFHIIKMLSEEAIEVEIRQEKIKQRIQEIVLEQSINWKNFKITSKDLPKESLLEIFSFLDIKKRTNFNNIRWCCKTFKNDLHDLQPLPARLWTTFPHPSHTSLRSLTNHLNAVAKDGRQVPVDLFIANGVYEIEIYKDEDGDVVNYVDINLPISIIGESREHCIVMGGLEMNGKKEGDINVSNLTLRESKRHGVFGMQGASIHLDNVSVENSEWNGVYVHRNKRNSMKNCNISHSKRNGLSVWEGGLMMIDGKDTTIHHNCTDGYSGYYGLHANNSSSSIHLVSSLTIETISKNNEGGGNYGGFGTIAIVDNEGTIIEKIQEPKAKKPKETWGDIWGL